MRPSGPASRHWTSPRRRAGRRRQASPRMWALLRLLTNAMSSIPRFGMSPRASRYADSSSTRRRWPRAWRHWRGSGRPSVIRRRLEAIGEAAQAAPGPSGLLNLVPSQRARLLLVQGDLAGAARWTSGEGFTADDEAYPKEAAQLVLARVLLAQGLPGRALALLDRLHAAAAAQDRIGSLIKAGTLRALALAASGEEAAALTALSQALTLACPQGYVRVFADEGQPMAALLGRLDRRYRRTRQAAAEIPLGYLARLQRALDPGHASPDPEPGAASAVPGLVEPLTSRELEVIGMLAAGVEPGHRGGACGHTRHCQEARQPPPGQARRDQPDRGRRAGTRAGSYFLSAIPASTRRGCKTSHSG